jgi:hypothetical protein
MNEGRKWGWTGDLFFNRAVICKDSLNTDEFMKFVFEIEVFDPACRSAGKFGLILCSHQLHILVAQYLYEIRHWPKAAVQQEGNLQDVGTKPPYTTGDPEQYSYAASGTSPRGARDQSDLHTSEYYERFRGGDRSVRSPSFFSLSLFPLKLVGSGKMLDKEARDNFRERRFGD